MDIHVVLAQQSYKHPDNPRRGNTIGSGAYLNRLATLQKIEPDGLLDLEQAALYASDNLGDYSSLFKNAVIFIQSESEQKSEGDEDELPEEQVIEAHDLAYKENRASSIKDAKLTGAAAAIHAYNQFLINGGTSLINHSNHSNHPDSKSKLIGLAMVEAVKLFDANADGKGQGPKQDAVNYSGITAIKLIKKTQQMSGQGTKSSGVGGISRMIGKIFARLRPQES